MTVNFVSEIHLDILQFFFKYFSALALRSRKWKYSKSEQKPSVAINHADVANILTVRTRLLR